jgi:hypothetical protein
LIVDERRRRADDDDDDDEEVKQCGSCTTKQFEGSACITTTEMSNARFEKPLHLVLGHSLPSVSLTDKSRFAMQCKHQSLAARLPWAVAFDNATAYTIQDHNVITIVKINIKNQ